MLKSEQIDKWIEALESGEYEQGRGNLLCDGRYCCLGVLCELEGRLLYKEHQGWGDEKSNHLWGHWDDYIGGDLIPLEMQSHLAGMNDTDRLTFKQIAGWIRHYREAFMDNSLMSELLRTLQGKEDGS